VIQRHDDVEGFILAGGQSARMGGDKALLKLGGVPLLQHVTRRVEPLVARLTIVGPPDRYAAFGFRVIPDARPRLGPLGGIATALSHSANDWNLVVACDLPYLTAEWLDFLIVRAQASQADVLLPQTAHGAEPLCAMYRTRCAAHIAGALQRGVRKITEALTGLTIDSIRPQQWKTFDSAGSLFKNMNTLADYEEARARLEGARR